MKKSFLFLFAILMALSCTSMKNHVEIDNDLRYKISGSDIIIDASDLLDEIPRQDLVMTAASLGTEWLYNDFAIKFRTHSESMQSNYLKEVVFPKTGTYYLYVRAIGSTTPYEGGRYSDGFRIRLNDAYVEGTFGTSPEAVLTKAAEIKAIKGETAHLWITRITGRPSLDCIVLSMNPDLSEADLKKVQLPDYIVQLREYNLGNLNCVKFGDVTGDGKTDLVAFAPDYSSYVYDNAGKLLWSWQAPVERANLRAEFECPGLVWDFDRDGKAEIVQWREDAEGEWLVMVKGDSGEILHKVPWPCAPHPHVYNNFRLAVANTDGIYPASVLLYSDCGVFQTYGIFDQNLRQVWRHELNLKKDHLGHYFYAHDFDKDGIDEIVGGWKVVDAHGNILWSKTEDIYDNHDHADTYRFADMDGDGIDDVVVGACELGLQVRDAFTGELKTIAMAEHLQQIEVGHFLDGYDLPTVAAGARLYQNRRVDPYLLSQVYWIDAKGNQLFRWPANALNGNPDLRKGDFFGNGREVCFWNRFLMQTDGRGKLCCIGDIYHVFDFERNGYAQVITLTNGKLRVFGWAGASGKRKPNNDPDFLKESVANHTHY
jgi:hypothetical protein